MEQLADLKKQDKLHFKGWGSKHESPLHMWQSLACFGFYLVEPYSIRAGLKKTKTVPTVSYGRVTTTLDLREWLFTMSVIAPRSIEKTSYLEAYHDSQLQTPDSRFQRNSRRGSCRYNQGTTLGRSGTTGIGAANKYSWLWDGYYRFSSVRLWFILFDIIFQFFNQFFIFILFYSLNGHRPKKLIDNFP